MPKGPAALKAQSVTSFWEHITPCQRIASPAAAWFSLRLGPRKGKKKLNSFETARGGRMQFSPSIFHFFSQSLLFLNILLKIWIAELPGGVQYPLQHCGIRINHSPMPLHCCSGSSSLAPCSSWMELLTCYSCWIPCGSCDDLGHSTSFWRSGPFAPRHTQCLDTGFKFTVEKRGLGADFCGLRPVALQVGLYWAIYGKGTNGGTQPTRQRSRKDSGLVRWISV